MLLRTLRRTPSRRTSCSATSAGTRARCDAAATEQQQQEKQQLSSRSRTSAAAVSRSCSGGSKTEMPMGAMRQQQPAAGTTAITGSSTSSSGGCRWFMIAQQSCKTLCTDAVQSGAACACEAMVGCTFGLVEAGATAGFPAHLHRCAE
jgi:hypothetical protein